MWFALLAAFAVQASAAVPLSATSVLLPLAAFTGNNTALVSAYACAPSYASTPCSGHGGCYLLLDSAANTSQPFIQAATVQPTLVSGSSLDTDGIDGSTPLPAAVCVCDSGWTGRGDFINHSALDGDSCHVQQSAVVAQCVTGVVMMSLLLVLATYRLTRWYAWHAACAASAGGAAATSGVETQASSGHPSHSSEDEAEGRVADITSQHIVGPLSPQHPLSPHYDSSALSEAAPIASSVTDRQATSNQHTLSPNFTVRQTPHSKPRTTQSSPGAGTRVLHSPQPQPQREGVLLKHMKHISFVHPFCSLVVGGCVLSYFVLRLTTDHVVGNSYLLSALLYVQYQPFVVAVSLGTYNNLQMAATFTRTTTGATGLSTAIRAAKRYLLCLCFYSLFGCQLLWFIPAYPARQQLLSVLVLLFGFLPVLLIGPISVITTQRVTAALLRHMESLSAEQQQQRRTAYKKLRTFSLIITAIVGLDAAFCLLFACDAALRQAGMPLFALGWHLSMCLILLVRLLLLRTPARAAASTAVAVHPVSPQLALTSLPRGAALLKANASAGGRLPVVQSNSGKAESDSAGVHELALTSARAGEQQVVAGGALVVDVMVAQARLSNATLAAVQAGTQDNDSALWVESSVG